MTGTMLWFGHKYNAPAWEDMPQSSVDYTGQPCLLCSEPIAADDDGLSIPEASSGMRNPVHVGCFLTNLGIARRPERIES